MLAASGSTGRRPVRCGADLSTAHVIAIPAHHPAIAAQQAILDVVASGSTSTGIYESGAVSAAQYMRDVAAIGMRALRYGSPTELTAAAAAGDLPDVMSASGGSVEAGRLTGAHVSPPSPGQTAVAACVAVPVLSAASSSAAGAKLRWLVETARTQGFAVSATNIGWARDVSPALVGAQLAALSPFLGPSDHLRYRSLTSRPRRPVNGAVPEVHRSLPALLWHRWVHPLSDTVVGIEQVRLALSVAVVLTSGPVSLADACSLLGGVMTPQTTSRVLQALGARSDWAAVTVALAALADALVEHPAPIDYGRRRRLPMHDLLPDSLWHSISRTVGVRPGSAVRLAALRCWLYERITGSPARMCPRTVCTSEFRAKVADLPRILFPELVDALDDAGRRFLDYHGLAGEPLRWTPPARVAAAWLARSSSRGAVDVPVLHDLIGSQDMTLGAAAARLNVPIDTVRAVLNDEPAPRRAMTVHQRRVHGAASAQARAHLSRDRFIELYVGQGLTLRAISAMVGVSRQTLARLARDYDITLRPPINVRRGPPAQRGGD
jgi:hypothetical protein